MNYPNYPNRIERSKPAIAEVGTKAGLASDLAFRGLMLAVGKVNDVVMAVGSVIDERFASKDPVGRTQKVPSTGEGNCITDAASEVTAALVSTVHRVALTAAYRVEDTINNRL